MSDEFVRVNIAVKPSEVVAKQAIEISQKLSDKSKAYFVLNGQNYFPHLTVYSPEFPKNKLDGVLGTIESICAITKSFESPFLDIQSHDGYIDVEVELNDSFRNLHNIIVEKLNPLREGHLREKYTVEENLIDLSESQRQNINEYGYPDVMESFRPHLTLIRFEDPGEALSLVKNIKWNTEKLTVGNIATFTMSSHGTCSGLIKEFSLKP